VKRINKVLLIDDDHINNHLSKSVLEKLDFAEEIVIKTNGKEAINYLLTDCSLERKFPDLILLDLNMPVLDGFEFLDEFDKLKISKEHDIIINILTTSRNGDDIIRIKDLRKYHIINKPLTVDQALDIYHRYFRNWGFKEIPHRSKSIHNNAEAA
jgi:CheY-like chemotaxis protein